MREIIHCIVAVALSLLCLVGLLTDNRVAMEAGGVAAIIFAIFTFAEVLGERG